MLKMILLGHWLGEPRDTIKDSKCCEGTVSENQGGGGAITISEEDKGLNKT